MKDWDIFADAMPWVVNSYKNVKIGKTVKSEPISSDLSEQFPVLAKLICAASITPVEINNKSHKLFCWNGNDDERVGWLTVSGENFDCEFLCPAHRELIKTFGGIVEYFSENEEHWLLNNSDVMTLSGAQASLDGIKYYFESENIPIELSDYYPVSLEANGNKTLCGRKNGDIIMFASDHAFDFVTPLENCKEYTFYKINGCENFQKWVETIAMQWAETISWE